ncbi:MAG TPA: glycosyltransferase family 4 protein [Thermotogota bacterium]|nr:glycosyltransferase family 4 protein [Thermotogota bacterium]
MKIIQLTAVEITLRAFLLPLVKDLCEQGHELHLACSDPGETLQNHPVVRQNNVQLHKVPIPRSMNPVLWLKGIGVLKALFREIQPDVVHTHTPVASFLGRFAAKKTRVPHILTTAHGFYFHEGMNPLVFRAISGMEKYFCKRYTDVLFTVNSEDHDYAVSHRFLPPDRIIPLPGVGIDTKERFNPERFTPERKHQFREKLSLSDDDPTLLFVGRLVQEKGVLDLVNAMQQVWESHPRLVCLFAGEALPSDRDQSVGLILAEFAEKHPKRVRLLGLRSDIPDLLSISNLLALPSYREGMPVAPLEALSMGVPVVGTRIRGLREEVEDGKTGYLVPVASPSQLAQAIMRVLSEAKAWSATCRQKAVQTFSTEPALQPQLAVYRSLK